ncbi:MAG TPA: sigma-70 family RNA polymerase sigma factor [Kofleriaceae bacterium]|nr:sigma-70 family RNA polymerase sigma factor [Kofleriaceae bacterium]
MPTSSRPATVGSLPPDAHDPGPAGDRDELYREVVARFGASLERVALAFEHDRERRRDLLQEIHVAIWRSLSGFDGRCSLKTWIYRVAHNVAASHVLRDRRDRLKHSAGLDELESLPADGPDPEGAMGARQALDRIEALIRRLAPLDRQVIVLYLEGLQGAEIADVTGLSAGNVATRVHRIKGVLARWTAQGDDDA